MVLQWTMRPFRAIFSSLSPPAGVARRVNLGLPQAGGSRATWPRFASGGTPPPPPPLPSANGKTSSRVEKILSRLPPSMRKYTRRLHDAPVSHMAAFLLLHEITAMVPLMGLFGVFHYCTDYVPLDYMMGHYGGQVAEGVRRFERYFRRKGWFGFGQEEGAAGAVEAATAEIPADTDTQTEEVRELWTSTDAKYKIVVEIGLAYAITKVLLPVRIVFSLWATPWFAGVMTRLRGLRGITSKRS